MISWIQAILKKHARWIFVILLVILIVPFVFTIGNTPGCVGTEVAVTSQEFYGIDLSDPRQAGRLVDAAAISAAINGDVNRRSPEQLQQQALTRAALLHLADRLGIPQPGPEQLSAFIPTRPLFQNAEGAFSRDRYLQFLDRLKANPNANPGMVEQVLLQDFRIETVMEAISGPGAFLPIEARLEARRSQTVWSLRQAAFPLDRYRPDVVVDPDDLRAYYENNSIAYQRPPEIDAAFVVFEPSAYLSEVGTPDKATLVAYFEENRPSYAHLAGTGKDSLPGGATAELEAAEAGEAAFGQEETGNADSEAETETTDSDAEDTVTFTEAREAVTRDWRLAEAATLARIAAEDFTYQLYDKGIDFPSDAFDATLAEEGLGLRNLQPFSSNADPADILPGFSRQAINALFQLPDNRYYTDPLPFGNGYAVYFIEERRDARVPPLEEVIAEVREDFVEQERRRLFAEQGQVIREAIEANLNASQTFREAVENSPLPTLLTEEAAEAGESGADFFENKGDLATVAEEKAGKLPIRVFQDFTARNPPEGLNPVVFNSIQGLPAGGLSRMITTGDTGYFVYVSRKEVPEVSESDPAYRQAETFISQFHSFMGNRSIVEELIARGMESSGEG
ncbi:MAG: peptidylprolyl isomerase [Opitutales bacterium]